ncbi:hypothetical protein RFI_16142 [Reticulomyxa filosa]|uniref:Uncharacterized protein n=1 Tax=Reticulomyxa filosa TaxID=46433 RepID=X6N5P1_RETFI|nr:hypothetical protein RFI_16142 [Reticulomyxa filosa]|eukprot:ETO21064.1 hypothetical protein RFI_16142 [Reticulomyxa filosa]
MSGKINNRYWKDTFLLGEEVFCLWPDENGVWTTVYYPAIVVQMPHAKNQCQITVQFQDLSDTSVLPLETLFEFQSTKIFLPTVIRKVAIQNTIAHQTVLKRAKKIGRRNQLKQNHDSEILRLPTLDDIKTYEAIPRPIEISNSVATQKKVKRSASKAKVEKRRKTASYCDLDRKDSEEDSSENEPIYQEVLWAKQKNDVPDNNFYADTLKTKKHIGDTSPKKKVMLKLRSSKTHANESLTLRMDVEINNSDDYENAFANVDLINNHQHARKRVLSEATNTQYKKTESLKNINNRLSSDCLEDDTFEPPLKKTKVLVTEKIKLATNSCPVNNHQFVQPVPKSNTRCNIPIAETNDDLQRKLKQKKKKKQVQ